MIEDEVISISDSECSEHSLILLNAPSQQQQHVNNNSSSDTNENKAITISSYTNKSTERCPVTWNNTAVKKSKIKYLDSESFLSPSPRMKVSSWLFGNCQGSSVVNLKNSLPTYAENKSAILIRQDYRKPHMLHNLSSPSSPIYLSCNRYKEPSNICQDSVVSVTSRESSASSHIQLNSSNSTKDSIKEQTLVNLSKITTPIDAIKLTCVHKKSNCTLCDRFSDTLSIKVDETKSTNSPIDLEVPNKIELCEYLKLMNMNPVDGKVVEDKKNRRSSRVKNLALMSEKRALERELNTDAQSYEKKKCTNSIDQDVKSSTGSHSSKESGRSSKISKRTNLSSSTRKTVDKKTPTLRRHSDEENKVRNFLDLSEDLKHYSIRTKSLQVPEVSTTSSSKIKLMPDKIHKVQDMKQKSPSKRVDLNKNTSITDSSPSSERTSVIMTKKSLSQLNINVDGINSGQDTEKLFTINDMLLNYVAAIDKADFEDIFNKCISAEDINKHLKNKKTMITNNSKNQRIETPLNERKTKPKQVVKNVSKKKLRIIDQFSKPGLRKFHEKLKMKRELRMKRDLKMKRELKMKNVKKKPIKLKQVFRLYSLRGNLTQLRSRGSLKEIGIKSILLKHEKKRKKKRFSVKSTQVTPKVQQKKFTETVLIQKSSVCDQMEEVKRSEPHPSEFSSLKISKLKSEIDLLKNLTPEHRKALFESKKFLIVKSKENIKSFEQGCKQDDKSSKDEEIVGMDDVEAAQNVSEATVNTKDCDTRFTLPILERVAQQTQLDAELSRPTSEDLEVHTLMSSNYLKDQIIQETSTSVDAKSSLNNALDNVLKENWRCSTFKSSLSTNSSLEIIEPDQSSTKDVVIDRYNNENLVNEEIVETTSITTTSDDEEEADECENQPEVVDVSEIEPTIIDCVQLVDDHETTIKSLHHCLTQPRKKQKGDEDKNNLEWDEKFDGAGRSPKSGRKAAQSYAIDLSSSNGAVMNTYYLDYNLVIVQEFLISFWNQTSLGNVLGAQDMWMPKGVTKRIVLGNGCTHKESSESVMVLDNSMAYVELWTKEHKSDKRERPVADIFVTIYLRLNGSGPVKKVLQLENIHGYANDVQYIVLKNSPYITVSWNTVNDQLTSTVVHKYQLSSDYRTVTNIVAMQPAAHYISSLHNIEDSDTLIMGCGEDKITLWHIEDGYIVATMDLMAIAQQPRTLWAKADRGFIFTLHNFNDGYFHLIATNSFDYSWKQLQIYKQETEYENLLGICVENGLVIAFYDTGILCWSAKSGELLIDSSSENSIFLPFGKHIVVIIENQVHVRHVLEYLVTIDDS